MNEIYCGPPPDPSTLWTSWNLDPALIVLLLSLGYFARRSPSGLAGVGVLAVAFVSPLCALSSALFTARVVHHVLLVAVAAPLLARALPSATQGGAALPFLVSTLVLWGWHVPPAYDAAITNVPIYWAMQISLLAGAIWFWRSVLAPSRGVVEAVGFAVAGFGQMGLLGALLTFAPRQLYDVHAVAPWEWGLSPLTDQQLAGLVMWVPAGIPYVVATVLVARQGWGRMGQVT